MKTVCKLNQCAGCMACVDICPHNAIKIEDTVKAYNAIIQENSCVQCNLCHKVCPNNTVPEKIKPILWKQGWASDDNVRAHGASGGYAAAISKGFINNGGIVCSCTFLNGKFTFAFADTPEELAQFAGSKYIKSNPTGIYKSIKDKLNSNKQVLFIGLPCQVAALKNYIGQKHQENLFTIDLICHGTPSPKVLDIFLKQHGLSTADAGDVQFRNKGKFQVCVDGKSVITQGVCDSYMLSFLNSVTYTENCYNCQYAQLERVSDLTLGDSWGSDLLKQNPTGVSLLLCQTPKGQELISLAQLHMQEVNLDNAIKNNQQLRCPAVKPDYRDAFLQKIIKNKKFEHIVFRYIPKLSIKHTIKMLLIKLGIIHR